MRALVALLTFLLMACASVPTDTPTEPGEDYKNALAACLEETTDPEKGMVCGLNQAEEVCCVWNKDHRLMYSCRPPPKPQNPEVRIRP